MLFPDGISCSTKFQSRAERVEASKERLSSIDRINLFSLECDVSAEKNHNRTFLRQQKSCTKASMFHPRPLNKSDSMWSVIDTNVMGLVFCTHKAFKSKSDELIFFHINSRTFSFLWTTRRSLFRLKRRSQIFRQDSFDEILNIKER